MPFTVLSKSVLFTPSPFKLALSKLAPSRFRLELALLSAGFLSVLLIQSAQPAYAHGATIQVVPQAVEVIATFDNGEPMSNAQVRIYAPDELNEPWQTGQTDSEGRFWFTPEADKGGNWEVMVRKAGHGQTTTFALDALADGAGVGGQAAPSSASRWLSMLAIIWGFVGTALYFSRRNSPALSSHARDTIHNRRKERPSEKTHETSAAGLRSDR